VLAPLAWLLAIQALGLLAFPITFVLLRRLPDRGYAFAKPLALVLSSYLLWVLGLTQLVPNSRLTILAILALGALVSGWLLRRNLPQMKGFLKAQWRPLLAAEVLFLVSFGFWLFVVSAAPAINHTEKPMDFAFLNGVLHSTHFPPEDPWLAGHSISYYYFGHFMMASLVQLTGVSPAVGYNLAVALVPALLGMGAFGLLYNLVRLSGGTRRAGVGFGLLAPVLLMLAGNLQGTLELAHARGWGGPEFWSWVGVKGMEAAGPGGSLFPEQPWWWWRATRVIDTLADGRSLDYTITEFPFFSFLLGDLHPHMMSLPFLVLFLALALNLYLSPHRPGLGWLRQYPLEAAAVSLTLGALAFINTWDLPVFAAVLAALIFARSYSSRDPTGASGTPPTLSRAALNAGLMVTPMLAAAILLFLPFHLHLSSQASGVLPVTGPGTRPFLFFLVMGLPVLLAASFLLRQLPGLPRLNSRDAPAALLVLLAALVPLALWIIVVLALVSFTDGTMAGLARVAGRLLLTLPLLALAGLAGFCALQRARYSNGGLLAFPLLLAAAAFYLLSGAELFYVVDFFGNRMNTVFKVYYQSWLLVTLAGVYGIYYWQAQWGRVRKPTPRLGQYAWVGVVGVLALASFYYPVGATLDRTGLLRGHHSWSNHTLNGLDFIQQWDPGEYAAIRWLREEAPPGRVVEAVGESYSEHGRISASTGRPTILGWKGHQQQWRGTTTPMAGREEDVARIYQSDSPGEVLLLLERYDMRYVYLGRRERASYGTPNLDKLDGILKTVFAAEGVIIYERIAGTSTVAPSGSFTHGQ
jgi:YYY domain-containing protein